MVYILLSLSTLFWGGSFIATRYALTYGGFTVFTLLAGRFFISSVILLVIGFVKNFESLQAKEVGKLMLVGIVYPGLYFVFETKGLERTPAFISSLIIASIPVLTGVMSRVFLKEKLSVRGWIGVFVSIAGIVLVVFGQNSFQSITGNELDIIGVILVFGAALTGAFYTTTTRYLVSKHKPLTLTTFQNVLAFIFFSPLGIIGVYGKRIHINSWGIVSLIFLGIFASVVAFLCFNKALSILKAATASLFLNTIPIVSLILAWIFLGERINLIQLFGIIVVIGGVSLASVRRRRDAVYS